MKGLKRSKSKGYVKRQCAGCQLTSEAFPYHNKSTLSPNLKGKGVVGKRSIKFLDLVKHSINRVINFNSHDGSIQEENKDNCVHGDLKSNHHSSADVLAL